MDTDRRLDFADDQDGVVRLDRLVAAGLSYDEVTAQLDGRRWRRLGPTVVVLHNGPLTRRQELWAAVLNAGTPAALCGRTAAELAGLQGWPAPAAHVVVPRGRLVDPIPHLEVYVHESRRFTASDVHPSRVPPQTTPARAVLDAAVWNRRARTACGLVAAAVQQRVVTADQLVAELDAAGRVRFHVVLRRALAEIAGGAGSVAEIDFGRFCERHGLPRPVRQVLRREPGGKRRYLDAVLPGTSGRDVAVEIDGGVHLTVERYWDDMTRDNELTIGGDRLLRFPVVAMHVDAERMADQLRRALVS